MLNKALFPEMPAEWQRWPCLITVGFTLTPVTCVYDALFKEYQRDSCEQAATTLFDKDNREIFVHYSVRADGFVPAFEWYVSWPILRKGDDDGLTRRESIQGPAPWECYPDDTLCEVWNRPNGVYGFTQTYMLRAGGRTREEAVANWKQSVVPFRRLLKLVRQKSKE